MIRLRNVLGLLTVCASLFSFAAMAQSTEAPTVTSPRKLLIGTDGTLEVGLLLQGWLLYDHMDDVNTSSFRLRRSEISVRGEVIPKRVAFKVMFDPARVLEAQNKTIAVSGDTSKLETVTVLQPQGALSALQDMAITFLSHYADVSIGQFKVPVSWEGFNSSGKLLFAERSEVARRYGDKRDLGVQAAKTFEKFGYTLGVYNGSGSNNLDQNNSKDLALRLEAYPVKGLTIAGVGYATVGDRQAAGAKDRYEGDVRYQSGPLLLHSEFIRARDVGKGGVITNAQGYYAAAAWAINEQVQPCVRGGHVDPNLEKDNDEQTNIDLGFNYFLRGHEAKLQFNYGVIQRPEKPREHVGTFATQLFF